MRIECETCGELVTIDSFATTARGIELTCPACDETYEVSAAERSVPIPEGPMTCPKCGTRQPEADACRACGLLGARFDDFSDGGAGAPEELVALWEACEADWDRREVHDRFVEAASACDGYVYAARRYREALRARPEDEHASAALKRITRMAEAALMARSAAAQQADEGNEPYKNVVILLIALVLLAGVGAMYAMLRGTAEETAPPPVPGLERR